MKVRIPVNRAGRADMNTGTSPVVTGEVTAQEALAIVGRLMEAAELLMTHARVIALAASNEAA